MKRFLVPMLASALLFCGISMAHAAEASDVDGDGLLDAWEERLGTDLTDPDTDKDGFADRLEIENGYDPAGPGRKLAGDSDGDGLNDRLELLFGTSLIEQDSDGDGKSDGAEVAAGFSPVSTSTVPLQKRIEIKLSTQRLKQILGNVVLAEYIVSTGKKSTPTPPGTYKIQNKNPRAWSRSAKLWMPYWMQFSTRGFGLHELPEWPNGRKEGEKSLGQMVSGGCVRLGVGEAKILYDWAPVGTEVKVVK